MTDAEAKEAMHLARWWISRSPYRFRLVHSAGGLDVCLQEMIVHMLRFPASSEYRFSTWVINSLQWSICRLCRMECRGLPHDAWTDQPDRRDFFATVDSQDSESAILALLLKHLDPRHAGCVVRWCHGETLEEIGKAFGFSRERARQLIVKGIRRASRLDLAERIYFMSGARWDYRKDIDDDGNESDAEDADTARDPLGCAAAAGAAVCAE